MAPRLFLLVAFLLLPAFARAEVFINEIAWMGTDTGGANCEWIELRNTAADIVSLSGWSLTIENSGTGAPKVLDLGEVASVKYSGIAGNGYYLIARDSSNSGVACKDLVPGTSADWLGSFGNGISNSGAKLLLKKGTEEIDTVDSKAGWETSKGGVGGKNTSGQTKETPQRSGDLWITALPTPRGPNQAPPLEELPEEDKEATTTPVVTIGGTAPLVPIISPIATLYIEGGPARIVSAGAHTAFSALVYDSTGVVHKNADVSWSFGDGGQEKGEEVSYAYRKPGDYTVVARARSKGLSAVSLIPVVVENAAISITDVSADGITLTNTGDRLVDLSSWKFMVGRKSFALPEDTVLWSGASVLFAWETLRLPESDDPELHFPNGKLAVAYEVQPQVAGASIEEVQAVEPVARVTAELPTYEDAASAPARDELLAAAGAATSTVILKERGTSSFFLDFVASVAGFIIR